MKKYIFLTFTLFCLLSLSLNASFFDQNNKENIKRSIHALGIAGGSMSTTIFHRKLNDQATARITLNIPLKDLIKNNPKFGLMFSIKSN